MFDQVVLAGGGNRCWWQAGLWDALQPALGIRPRIIASTSGGSCNAAMIYTRGDALWTMRRYAQSMARIQGNAQWGNLWRRGEPVFPHYRIHTEVLLDTLGESFHRLKSAPEIRIGLSRIPKWLGTHSAVATGLVAYNIDKHLRKALHPTLGRKIGFRREFVTAQSCADVRELVDLLMHSACTPPFTPALHRDGRPVLDGGMVDGVAVDGLDDAPGKVLVLVTRRYPRPHTFTVASGGQERLYVQPSEKVPVSSWDFSSAQKLQEAYDLGRRDGDRLLARLRAPA